MGGRRAVGAGEAWGRGEEDMCLGSKHKDRLWAGTWLEFEAQLASDLRVGKALQPGAIFLFKKFN